VTLAFSDLDELAAFLLRRAGVASHPVPVERVALALGADRICTEWLEGEEGRLELRGSEVAVVAHADASPARRRFTIMHEAAHLVCADPRLDLSALRSRPALSSEERFCDRLAEALLMPAPWVYSRYAATPRSLSTVLHCARSFGVSAAAANLRLLRCVGWQRSLLRFQPYRGTWQLAAVTGWKPEPRAGVKINAATAKVLGRFAQPDAHSLLWLPLHCGGRELAFGAELWGRGRDALALVDYRRRRSYRPGERVAPPPELADPALLKLFYSLDDIDACILPASSERDGKNGQSGSEAQAFEEVAALRAGSGSW
jgi:hypothetical protein